MLSFAIALLIATPVQLSLQPGSRLWIEGDSNRNKYSCEATRLEGFARAFLGLVKCKDRIVVRFDLKARAGPVERRSASVSSVSIRDPAVP